MIPKIFEREALLIGTENVEKLMNATVTVFGAGGVGSYVVEGLVRAGIGCIITVDSDTVNETNINRQLIADSTTLGMNKTAAVAQRAKRINPNVRIEEIREFVTKENAPEILGNMKTDYIVDAIDTVSAKIAIIKFAFENHIRIISSMGTGNKLSPELLRIGDIYETSICPLARVMRRELRQIGIARLDVLWSSEEPVRNSDGEKPVIKGDGRNAPGSISFVPSVGGLLIASHVVRSIIAE